MRSLAASAVLKAVRSRGDGRKERLAGLTTRCVSGATPRSWFNSSSAAWAANPVPLARNALMALARTNNFELRVRAVELSQQGFRVDLAKNERFPSLNVGPSYSEQKAGSEEQRILGLGISLPLPLWNRNQGNIQAAVARQVQAEVSLNVTERDIHRKVTEAVLTYETKLREMANWRPDSVRHFKEAADIADRHYRLGAVPISTYVELQKQYLDAVEGLLDTKKEALEAASQLELLTGLPIPLAEINPSEEPK